LSFRATKLDPVTFIDRCIRKNERGQSFRLAPHQRQILRLAFFRFLYTTIVYSCPKKDGKTTLAAALVLWWAFINEDDEVFLCANDLEQSQGRVFKTVCGLLKHNPILAEDVTVTAQKIILPNGSVIQAVASDYKGAAGSNHGLTVWDELWGFMSENSRRMWEELTPVPTRSNSIRLVVTYAGWEGESELLWSLYKQGVGKEEHPDGQGQRIDSELPIYANKEARLFCYWDHEARMPWQTPEYRDTQRRTLRPGTYLRLHENRWTTGQDKFIPPEMYDACVDPALSPLLPTHDHSLFVGVDAATKHDCAAVVAVRWDGKGEKLILAGHRIWRPTSQQPLDLEQTIEAYLCDLNNRYSVAKIIADPYQLHRSIMTLQNAGLPIEEYPQTVANTTKMGGTLFDLLNGKNLRLYPTVDLRQHVLNAVGVETPRGTRLAKEKAAAKIDACVALAMAAVSALERPVIDISGIVCVGRRLDIAGNWLGEDTGSPWSGIDSFLSKKPDW